VLRSVLMGGVILLALVLLLLMLLSWRNRKRRQSNLAAPATVPAQLGAVHGVFDGLYVATTIAGDRLNRVAVGGLGFRAQVTLTVADAGLVLALRGSDDVFIPVESLREVTRATWTIDRAVERGGLIQIGWSLGADISATDVDSFFRLDASTELLDALDTIFPAPIGRKA
jgi:hypothetical protein